MKKFIPTILLFLFTINCSSQNDTIYLEKEYILFQDKEYNKSTNDGERTGEWIEYEIHHISSLQILGSGSNENWYDDIENKYRYLEDSEYNGIEILISKNIDTINGTINHNCVYHKILNRIPKDNYYILAEGTYLNNLKNGKWIYYYKTGSIKKVIDYSNGKPKMGFKIFHEDGRIIIGIIKINNTDWNIIRYSEEGVKLESKSSQIDEFKFLY